jgi:glutaredoxin
VKAFMQKKLNTFLLIGIIVFVLVGIVSGSRQRSQNGAASTVSTQAALPDQTAVILYYGDTCPHCKELEAWLEEQQVTEKLAGKIELQRKEVYNNPTNAQELTTVAQSCGAAEQGVGVPFLYAQGTCLVGTDQIESYFESQMSEATASPSLSVVEGGKE